MVSMAGGMARRGVLPVVPLVRLLPLARPNEQIYNQCTEGSKVIYVGSLAGAAARRSGPLAPVGARHLGAGAAVPNLSLLEPCCEAEVHALLDYAGQRRGRQRVPAAGVGEVADAVSYPRASHGRVGAGLDRPRRDDAVVFGYGPWLLANAFEAADRSRAEHAGASIRLVNLPWLNRVDRGGCARCVGGRRSVVTLDNHYLNGGQGEMIAAAIAELGLEPTPRVCASASWSCPSAAPTTRCSRTTARRASPGRGVPRRVARPSTAGTQRMTVLFWDIDGTLLTTGKAGVPAWDGRPEIVRRDFQLSSIRVAGLTDYQIAVRTFEMLGVEARRDATCAAWCGATRSCCRRPCREAGTVLPNVREILEHLEAAATCGRTC